MQMKVFKHSASECDNWQNLANQTKNKPKWTNANRHGDQWMTLFTIYESQRNVILGALKTRVLDANLQLSTKLDGLTRHRDYR